MTRIKNALQVIAFVLKVLFVLFIGWLAFGGIPFLLYWLAIGGG
ncbi:MAG TPA: hypothetical protein VIY48_01915 [Candidatus Paceibacterota bacterium]